MVAKPAPTPLGSVSRDAIDTPGWFISGQLRRVFSRRTDLARTQRVAPGRDCCRDSCDVSSISCRSDLAIDAQVTPSSMAAATHVLVRVSCPCIRARSSSWIRCTHASFLYGRVFCCCYFSTTCRSQALASARTAAKRSRKDGPAARSLQRRNFCVETTGCDCSRGVLHASTH